MCLSEAQAEFSHMARGVGLCTRSSKTRKPGDKLEHVEKDFRKSSGPIPFFGRGRSES
jgi:hypothetical protein